MYSAYLATATDSNHYLSSRQLLLSDENPANMDILQRNFIGIQLTVDWYPVGRAVRFCLSQ
jgi:hypothetical protein